MHWLNPNQLPEIVGVADRFLLNPHGQADGMILTEVHFPPHLSDGIHAAMRPGGTVKVRGVRPRSADMIAAVAIETRVDETLLSGIASMAHTTRRRMHHRDGRGVSER